jgi:hypothetical protein
MSFGEGRSPNPFKLAAKEDNRLTKQAQREHIDIG